MAEEENENIAIHYIDETVIRVGRERRRSSLVMDGWMDGWIAIEHKSKTILDMHACVFLERSILVAEQFLQELIKNMENIHLH